MVTSREEDRMTTIILKGLLRTFVLLFILFLVMLPLRSPYPASFDEYDEYPSI